MDDCRVMLLDAPHTPLRETELPSPVPGRGQVRIRVEACGVCRTDLHLVDGELPQAVYPVVPGHEVVGIVEALGPEVQQLQAGDRVGVPWLAHTCGACPYCLEGRENLCDHAQFTGCTRNGGYATHMLADAAWCVHLPGPCPDPARVAPLLCAGLIGWRAYRAAWPCRSLGLYGFGAAAHIIAQLAIAQQVQVHAFTRPGDLAAQAFARELGVFWAGGSDQAPPHPLDAAVLFAPSGELVPRALAQVRKGGRVVCAGIHMSDIPAFPYRLLWQERQLVSVANLTRADASGFFEAIAPYGIRTHIQRFELSQANLALAALRQGHLQGAAVLVPASR